MKLQEFFRRVYERFNTHDCLGLSSEIAYHSLFSIFPLLLLLVSVVSVLARFSGIQAQVFTLIYDFTPPVAADFINNMIVDIMSNNSLGLLGLGLLITLWAGSAVMDSLIKALDRIYEVGESRPLLRRKIFSMLLLFVAILLFIVSTILVFLGDTLLSMVSSDLPFMNLLQIAGTFVLVTVNIVALNRFAPNVTIQPTKLLPGALFFSVTWISATYIFRFYVSNFGRYNMIYGSIGGIIVLLTWIYMTVLLLLTGAVINSVLISREK